MKMLTILLLATAFACQAQTAPTVKGHTLGESIQEFTAKADDLSRGLLNDCTVEGSKSTRPHKEQGCRELLQVLETGNGTLSCAPPMYKIGVCRNFDGYAVFVSGKLVEIDLKIWDTPWSDGLGEAVAKFGKPDDAHVEAMQNGYGATFDLQSASWATLAYVVDLTELINTPYNLKRYMFLRFISREYFDSKHKPHGSSLD